MTKLYDFSVADIQGRAVSLMNYRGKTLLIVNTASRCGFTPQYAGLEALYKELKGQGFAVLGFPCNQFGAQEPGDDAEIADFCKLTYDVSFPMFAKLDVNGEDAAPLFVWLKRQARGLFGTKRIKWNFTKFLVDRDGRVVKRFAPTTTPQAIRASVERLL